MVDDLNSFLVLSLEEKGPEADLTTVEENIWLDNTSYNEEVLVNALRWNLEEPVGLVLTDGVRGILEYHFALFTGQNCTLY